MKVDGDGLEQSLMLFGCTMMYCIVLFYFFFPVQLQFSFSLHSEVLILVQHGNHIKHPVCLWEIQVAQVEGTHYILYL